jgi:hypothetical protein
MGLEFWTTTPIRCPKTPGKKRYRRNVGWHKSPANGPVLGAVSVRLKIEVWAVGSASRHPRSGADQGLGRRSSSSAQTPRNPQETNGMSQAPHLANGLQIG